MNTILNQAVEVVSNSNKVKMAKNVTVIVGGVVVNTIIKKEVTKATMEIIKGFRK